MEAGKRFNMTNKDLIIDSINEELDKLTQDELDLLNIRISNWIKVLSTPTPDGRGKGVGTNS